MTITELIAESGAQCRIFDLGRKIHKIKRADFEQYELGNRPYPTPYLKFAWLAILTWQPDDAGKHNIWFLKLPLDEQGIVVPADRDAFIKHWLRVVQYPDQEHGEIPCHFKPDQHRLAYFHALALTTLRQAPTHYYSTARAYLSGDIEKSQWQSLGLQGIAETVARLNENDNETLLSKALLDMPAVPRNLWLGFLEHQTVSIALTIAINDALATVVRDGASPADLAAFARGLSASVSAEQRKALLATLMAHPNAHDTEFVTTLFSRCWQDLEGDLLLAALELLANQSGQVFMALLGDTMTLPNMRDRIIAALRNPSRSEKLAKAFGDMLGQLRGAAN